MLQFGRWCAIGLSLLFFIFVASFSLSTEIPVHAQNPTFDGRLNNSPMIPIAIYCDSRTSAVTIWRTYGSNAGEKVLVLSGGQITSALRKAANTGVNTKIGGTKFVSLWALNSKQLQAVFREPGVPDYDFIFEPKNCTRGLGRFAATYTAVPPPTATAKSTQ